jgi:hypothetical protein
MRVPVVVPCISNEIVATAPDGATADGSWSRQGACGETFAHAQLMVQAEAQREAKPAIAIGPPTTCALRDREADRPAQRAGSPAPGDAEKIRAIEVLRAGGERNGASRPLGVAAL